jgi:hypothetical protein
VGLKDNLNRIKGVAARQGDKIASGVDKATDVIDKKTGGKHTDKLQKLDNMADKLRKDDDVQK